VDKTSFLLRNFLLAAFRKGNTLQQFLSTMASKDRPMNTMTTTIARFALVSFLLFTLPGMVEAQYNYTIINGTVTITAYYGPGGALTIPSTIIGLPVTSIGAGVFLNCPLTNVTFSTNLISIGAYAFVGDVYLTSITIPHSVRHITELAFSSRNGLRGVIVPSSVTSLGDYAFWGCKSLTSAYFQGDAPSANSTVFNEDNLTVYYMPGTTGWGLTFGGCPTTIWEIVPIITSQPQSQTLNPGNTVTFTIAASGTVDTNRTIPLSYQWLFNGGTISGATTHRYIISNVQPADAGSYSVVFSGTAGSVTSAVAILAVLFPHAARATASVVNGFMVEATITDQGWGYTNTPSVRIIGGGGGGAQSVAVVSNGMVTAVNVLNPGAGYTNTPLVVIAPPFISNPVLAIAPMSFLSFSNLALGGTYQLQQSSGWYWSNRPVSFTATNALYTQMVAGVAGSGDYRLALNPVPAQAFATAIVDYGFVVPAAVTSGGSGYVTSPAVTIIGGADSNATAVAQISGGVVTNVIITDAGIGYTNAPTIRIEQPPAASVSSTAVRPVMRVDSAYLAPYDNCQIQFKLELGGTWEDWNGGLFSPTDVTNSQYLFITNGIGFFRLQYLP
jgi:hypothetical protein